MEAYLRKNPVLLLRAVLALVLIFGLISPVQSANSSDYRQRYSLESNVSCQLSLQVSCDVKMWQEKVALTVLPPPAPIVTPAPVLTVKTTVVEAAYSTNPDKNFIYNYESGNNPRAVNRYSGACGLGQALPCSKLPCSLNDYACQDTWFTNYAIARYGSWANAAYHERVYGWW